MADEFRVHRMSIRYGKQSAVGSAENITKNTNRSVTEGITRDITQGRDFETQTLSAADRAKLDGSIDALRADIASTYYDDRKLIKQWDKDDRARSLTIGTMVHDTTQARLDWAMQQISDRLDIQYDALARIAGSSHNCYVQRVYDDTMKQAMLQRASVLAEFDFKGIQLEDAYRDATLGRGAEVFLQENHNEHNDLINEWNALKGADTLHHEIQTTHDVTARTLTETILENTLAFKIIQSGEDYAQDNSDADGTYAGPAGNLGGAGNAAAGSLYK